MCNAFHECTGTYTGTQYILYYLYTHTAKEHYLMLTFNIYESSNLNLNISTHLRGIYDMDCEVQGLVLTTSSQFVDTRS